MKKINFFPCIKNLENIFYIERKEDSSFVCKI